LSAQRYSLVTPAVALSAATAKTAAAYLATTGAASPMVEWVVSFDGVTSSAAPVLAEVCTYDATTTGTRTTGTLNQLGGIRGAAAGTAYHTYTAEPTVLVAVIGLWLPAYQGVWHVQAPLGREPEPAASQGFALRLTAPAAVNARVTMIIEEG
jgi:uncharacterized protein RhaS with RHS repeats